MSNKQSVRTFEAIKDGAALPYTYMWDCGDSCHCGERTDQRIWHFPKGTRISINAEDEISILGSGGPWGSLGDYPEVSSLFFESEEEYQGQWKEITNAQPRLD